MKKKLKLFSIVIALTILAPVTSRAQSIADLIGQLTLDYQKLAGLKSILNQMYQGYETLSRGYNSVKDVSQGNFSLHEAFLNGLMVVSPTVRKYPRVANIISDQSTLMGEYRAAYSSNRSNPHFSPDELAYMLEVYNNLVNASLKNIDDLLMVMTDSKLRMSDAERLSLIDRIYKESHNQLSFLRQFNDQASKLAAQRSRIAEDKNGVRSIYGIN
jgi:hypothetical protein